MGVFADYTEVMKLLKNASLFDLYRIRISIQNAMENPERINVIRQCFALGDLIYHFSDEKNALVHAIVLEKNIKNVVVKNLCDQKIWNIPYYMINLSE